VTDADAVLSISRSLWGRLTPDVRAVAYRLDDATLTVRFLLADEPDGVVAELVSEAETECIADFWRTHTVSYVTEHVPPPQPVELQPGERWFLVRYEPSSVEESRPR